MVIFIVATTALSSRTATGVIFHWAAKARSAEPCRYLWKGGIVWMSQHFLPQMPPKAESSLVWISGYAEPTSSSAFRVSCWYNFISSPSASWTDLACVPESPSVSVGWVKWLYSQTSSGILLLWGIHENQQFIGKWLFSHSGLFPHRAWDPSWTLVPAGLWSCLCYWGWKANLRMGGHSPSRAWEAKKCIYNSRSEGKH